MYGAQGVLAAVEAEVGVEEEWAAQAGSAAMGLTGAGEEEAQAAAAAGDAVQAPGGQKRQ